MQRINKSMSVKKILLKFKATSNRVLIRKIFNRAKSRAEDSYIKLKAHFTINTCDKRILETTDCINNIQLIDKFNRNFNNIFINKKNPLEIIKNNQEYFKQIIEQAEIYIIHTFDLLGSKPKNLNTKTTKNNYTCIEWHRDFKSGYLYNANKFYKDIKIKAKSGGPDIKVPWELSRFQHLPILGQAYLITGEEKYAIEIKNQIEDWIDNNKPMFGVNWVCTMDVGIRIANMLIAYEYIRDSNCCNEEFLIKFIKSIYEHANHIMKNLEWRDELTSNHYLSDIIGILFVSIAVPIFKESQKWKEFAVRELVNEMEKQVYADGMDYEGSTSYHRLVLELFFYSVVLCRNNNIEMPKSFLDKLYKMFDFEYYILKPNGKVPQIGDDDSGRLFKFKDREVLEHSYLLCLGSIFFKEPKWKRKEFGYDNEAFWVFGEEGKAIWDEINWSCDEIKSKSFENSGIYIIRNKDIYLAISCGPNGQKSYGGHGHNDKLSFELQVGGKDFIIDPGTYLYTPEPEWRNRFRSTSYHNTLQIDDLEQNEITENLFMLKDTANAALIKWENDAGKEIFIGKHSGFKDNEHVREFIVDKLNSQIIIKDCLKGDKNVNLKRYLNLSPKVELKIISDSKIQLKNKDIKIFLEHDGDCHILKSYASQEYGEIQDSTKIEISNSSVKPNSILQLTIFYD